LLPDKPSSTLHPVLIAWGLRPTTSLRQQVKQMDLMVGLPHHPNVQTDYLIQEGLVLRETMSHPKNGQG